MCIVFVAPEVEQHCSFFRCNTDLLPGRLAIFAHNKGLLATQQLQYFAHTALDVMAYSFLQGFITFFRIVYFEEEISSRYFFGRELLQYGILLYLVDKR